MDITNEVLQHFKLSIHTANGYLCCEIDGSGKIFEDVTKMLDFYKDHPINYTITSVGVCIKAGRPPLIRTYTDGPINDSESTCHRMPNGTVELVLESPTLTVPRHPPDLAVHCSVRVVQLECTPHVMI